MNTSFSILATFSIKKNSTALLLNFDKRNQTAVAFIYLQVWFSEVFEITIVFEVI